MDEGKIQVIRAPNNSVIFPVTSDEAVYVDVEEEVSLREYLSQIEFKISNVDSVGGYSPGNKSGNIPLSNGTININLNTDMLENYHGEYYLDWTNATNKPDPTITLAGDATGSITLTNLSSGILNVKVTDDSHGHTIENVSGLQDVINNISSSVSSIVKKTSDYTITVSDHAVIADATNGQITLFLPAASTVVGRTFRIKKVDAANSVFINAYGSEQIDDVQIYELKWQFQAVDIISDGDTWYVF